MSKKLYVGNLPWGVDDQKLNDLFTPYGAVLSARVIKDKYSQKSKGFGFVEMDQDQDADKAIESLNGSDLDGRKIIVNQARPMKEWQQKDSRSYRR
jgi:RNA recognition motif-containing protein